MIIVDPYSYHFLNDKLLEPSTDSDDRNGAIFRTMSALKSGGNEVHTSDYLESHPEMDGPIDFYSLGMLTHRTLKGRPNIRFKAFAIHEPPVVAPRLYKILPELTATFEEVYLHNIAGDGYSVTGVERAKLRKLYHPMAFDHVLDDFWNRGGRLDKLVVINSFQNPWIFRAVDFISFRSPTQFKLNSVFEFFDPAFTGPEHYSLRLEAIAALAKLDAIDFYGRKWELKFSPRSAWPTYLRLRNRIMPSYRGECRSKFDVLSRYAFSLVIENSSLKGCISEKIFDCFYAGTIPVYFGPADIADYIPRECFVDIRQFGSWQDLWSHLQSLSPEARNKMRESGKKFFADGKGEKYVNFYNRFFSPSMDQRANLELQCGR